LKRTLPKEKTYDLYASILSESSRLEKLIGNLLLASRINNAYPYNFESLNFKQIIESIIKSIEFQHPEADIHFICPNEFIQLCADKEALVSVITNLIENSIKYSAAPAFVEIRVNRMNRNVILEISDHGFGIADAEKPKVLEQFYRTGNEETRQTKGTGLGLYIVDRIVRAHKGNIKIYDNIPTGTRIVITLPQNK